MGSKVWELLNGTGAQAAKSVTGYCATGKEMVNNFAGAVMHDGQMAINAAKTQAVVAKDHAGQVIDSVANQSIGEMARSARDTAVNAANHVVNTPVGTLASEAFMAGAGSRPVLALSDGIESARDYGKTVLGDIDQFYHNADGSYNRTKVGVTAAAGLGIAGIAGYNMNN